MDAFHMPVGIIVSTEGFRAIRAFVRLAVTREMFSFAHLCQYECVR